MRRDGEESGAMGVVAGIGSGKGRWRGGGPHISVVARERAVAQRGGAFVVVEGAATLSRGRIAPRQRNGLGRDGAESGAVGVVLGCGGGRGLAEGHTY